MKNKPGMSWGVDAHINLIDKNEKYIAIYYDNEKSEGEIIRIFEPKDLYEYYEMLKIVTFYNYNTCALCPLVKMEIDLTC